MGKKITGEKVTGAVSKQSPALDVAEGVQVGNMSGRHRLSRKRLAVLGIVGLIVVAAALTVVTVQKPHVKPKTAAENVADITNEFTASAKDKKSLQEAQNELKVLADKAKSPADKQTYAQTAVELYGRSDDKEGTLAKALEMEKSYHLALTAANIAAAYQNLANYPKAAEYYGLAANRSPKSNNPGDRSAYNDYLAAKVEMESMK